MLKLKRSTQFRMGGLVVALVVEKKPTVSNILTINRIQETQKSHSRMKIEGMSQLICSFLKIVVVSSRRNPRMRELPRRKLLLQNLLLAKGLFWGEYTLRRRERQNGPK